MKDSKPSIILYIIAGIMVLIGKAFNFELILLLFKPMVVPVIYYYYLQTKTKNTSVGFSICIWLFFLSDLIVMIYPDSASAMLYVMVCGMVSYLLLINFAIKGATNIKYSPFNIVFISILLLLLGFMLFTILNFKIEDIINNYFIYLTYGIVLIILVAISVFNNLSDSSTSNLHLCCMGLCILVSDLFYAFNKFIIALPLLDHINIITQFMSYYFMVSYFNSRRTDAAKNNIKSTDKWKESTVIKDE